MTTPLPDLVQVFLALEPHLNAGQKAFALNRLVELIGEGGGDVVVPPPLAGAQVASGPPQTTTDDRTFEEFSALIEAAGRPVPDTLRVWFQDVGGWETSTAEQRVRVYQRMQGFYDAERRQRPVAHESVPVRAATSPIQMANPGDDPTRCYACGTPGQPKDQRDGGAPYYECPRQGCGFQGREGRWIPSRWDTANWSEKRARTRSFAR